MLSRLLLISAAIIGLRWKFSFGTNTLAFFLLSVCSKWNKRFVITLARVVQTCRKNSLGFPPSVGALSTVKGSQSFWVGKAASYAYTVPCCADSTKRVSLSTNYLVAASGLCYKHVMIVNDDFSIISKWSFKLIDDPKVIIYDRHRFIIQATARPLVFQYHPDLPDTVFQDHLDWMRDLGPML